MKKGKKEIESLFRITRVHRRSYNALKSAIVKGPVVPGLNRRIMAKNFCAASSKEENKKRPSRSRNNLLLWLRLNLHLNFFLVLLDNIYLCSAFAAIRRSSGILIIVTEHRVPSKLRYYTYCRGTKCVKRISQKILPRRICWHLWVSNRLTCIHINIHSNILLT